MATKQAINAEIVRILRALRHVEGERRTLLYRDLAEQMVDLREHYFTPQGAPDWTGRTGSYRYAVRALYAEAGYNPTERRIVQTSTRYHTGNLVRERIPRAQADALGLNPASPQDRSRTRTARDRAELRALIAEAREMLGAAKQAKDGAGAARSNAPWAETPELIPHSQHAR